MTPSRRPRRAAAALLLLIPLLAALPASAQRVLVYPLTQEGGSPATGWIGTGLAVALDEALAADRIASVPYEELRSYYEQENLVSAPEFTRASRVSLAKHLGAGILVEGTFKLAGDRVETRVDALDLAGDLKLLGSWEAGEALSDLPGLTERLVDNLLTAMGRKVLPLDPVKPQAFESYIRGRIAEDLTLQEVYFRRALEIAPQYDNAKCHLALTLKGRGRLAESRALLESLEGRNYAKAYLGLLLLAEVRLSQGKTAEARQILHASLKEREGAEAHLALARVNLREKKYAEAEVELVMADQFGSQGDEIEALRMQVQAEKAALGKGGEK